DGTVTVEDIAQAYNSDFDPDVLSGRAKPDAALAMFLDQFDTVEKDGIVTLEEFVEYYKSVSASVDNDDYFELMIRNAWHIPGGELAPEPEEVATCCAETGWGIRAPGSRDAEVQLLLKALRASGSPEAAQRFGGILLKWAQEGRPYRGRVFSAASVEAAVAQLAPAGPGAASGAAPEEAAGAARRPAA
ncbi:unnamed protein product, partial [Prorocentrum cordatum]